MYKYSPNTNLSMHKSATGFGYIQPSPYLRFCIQPDDSYIQPKHVADILLTYSTGQRPF